MNWWEAEGFATKDEYETWSYIADLEGRNADPSAVMQRQRQELAAKEQAKADRIRSYVQDQQARYGTAFVPGESTVQTDYRGTEVRDRTGTVTAVRNPGGKLVQIASPEATLERLSEAQTTPRGTPTPTPRVTRTPPSPTLRAARVPHSGVVEEETGGPSMALWPAIGTILPGVINTIFGTPTSPPPPPQAVPPKTAPPIRVGPVGINPTAILPGGRPFTEPAGPNVGPTGQRPIYPTTGPQPPLPGRWKPNKSGYWRRDPSTGQTVWIAPGSIWVRVRRRNPANPRALSNSASRVDMFGGLVGRMEKKGVLKRKKATVRKMCFRCDKSKAACRCG